jgi:hypothetical protein
MIKAGDTLMNPVPKERMTFLKTAAETTDQAGCRETWGKIHGFPHVRTRTGFERKAADVKKWLYLTVLALALLTLAVGGWVVKGIKSATNPAGRLAPRPV